MSFGKELIQSAEEALAIAKGEVESAGALFPEKAHPWPDTDRRCNRASGAFPPFLGSTHEA